jgi:DNA polymerase-3 subunit epsilon
MMQQAFAVVDVETTHGDPMQGHIIELAVVVHDGERELEAWSSLVRPRTALPPFITRLTGIGEHMLTEAPIFPDVARNLMDLTKDRLMVAHNIRFDMTALEHEFARTGLVFHRNTLCTERLSRQLVPDLSHYNLGSLCRHFGIPFEGRHRALNDARAALQLFLKLRAEFGEERLRAASHWWPKEARV